MSDRRRVAVLLARAAIAATPVEDMRALAATLAGETGLETSFAFLEQGVPSLRERLAELRGQGVSEVLLLPLLMPVEPNFQTSIERALARWREGDPGRAMTIRLGPSPARMAAWPALLAAMAHAAAAAPDLLATARPIGDGSVVSPPSRRILVCLGGPCADAGAAMLWGHLRNRKPPGAVTSAKTSCLGPCSLAPVVQVYPEATIYGGVDENGIERILERHGQAGAVIDELAYPPQQGKQRLRRPR